MRMWILQLPVIGRLLLMGYRLLIALRYFKKPVLSLGSWLVRSREVTNFSYDLELLNTRYLAAFCAQITGENQDVIQTYMDELGSDEALRSHIQSAVQDSPKQFISDMEVRYARRIGWYAVTRAIKPKLVVETGVASGLGSCVLTAALQRNRAEGFEGRYIGTDINPQAGFLLQEPYSQQGEVKYGDSIATLEKLSGPIDLFINDSDHSRAYEAAEYEVVKKKLGANAIILGDNAHATDALMDFARETGRDFLFFQEVPARHWYPGAGIGAAFVRVGGLKTAVAGKGE
jgi:predicted O-methyltransferase YrrM